MILPSTYLFSMILLVLGMLCWGSWATTFKASGPKWRYELYYYDFAIGAFIAALIAGFTFGSLGWDGFSLLDDLRNAGKKQELFGFIGGAVFNLANMLILASVSIAGLSVGLPIGMGIALVISTLWIYFGNPGGNTMLMSAGCFCILAAVVVDALAFKSHAINKLLSLVQQGKTKSTKKTFNAKAIFLASVGGVLMGGFYPLLEMSRQSEIGLGPFGVTFVVSAGILFSTFVYNLFFMNLPVAGKVVDFTEYFKGSLKNHYLGIFGGMLWTTGAVCYFVASRAEGPAAVTPSLSSGISQAATLLAALWGLIVWKEFEGSDSKVKTLVSAMLVLFVVGLLLVSASPVYEAK